MRVEAEAVELGLLAGPVGDDSPAVVVDLQHELLGDLERHRAAPGNGPQQALVAARQGRTVCLAEVDRKGSLPKLFDAPGLDYNPKEITWARKAASKEVATGATEGGAQNQFQAERPFYDHIYFKPWRLQALAFKAMRRAMLRSRDCLTSPVSTAIQEP